MRCGPERPVGRARCPGGLRRPWLLFGVVGFQAAGITPASSGR